MADAESSIMSRDNHVIERPATWQTRLPTTKYRDAGPKVVHGGEGEAWVFETKRAR